MRGQLKMAAALEATKRRLIAWPLSLGERSIVVQPRSFALTAAGNAAHAVCARGTATLVAAPAASAGVSDTDA